jgi:hypothetical protein
MNPFTQSLLRRLHNHRLKQFVERWDALEALVVRVYKRGAADSSDEAEYGRIRAWLLRTYPGWQPVLEPYWRKTSVAGEPAAEDPFSSLLAVREAVGFAANWRAMQTLPAAREALNEYLVDSLKRENN